MTTANQFNELHPFNALFNRRDESIVDWLDRYVSRRTRRFLGLALALDYRFKTAFSLALRYSLDEAQGRNAAAASEYRARVRKNLSALYSLDEDNVNRIDDVIVRWSRVKKRRGFYEYQGDEYRSLILDIRQCERRIELFYQAGISANDDRVQREAKLRDELWWEAEELTGLDEFDVLYDIKYFEDASRVNPPAIRPTDCTL